MTKEELVGQIAAKLGSDTKLAGSFLEAFLSTIEETVQKGESIFIPGLGNFEPTAKSLKEVPRTQ
jgi:DNA-binding protein HU-beta